MGDIYRVIDLRGNTSLLANGDAVATVQAVFAVHLLEIPAVLLGNVSLNAMEEVPVNAEEWRTLIGTPPDGGSCAISARRHEVLSPVENWQKIDIDMRIPGKTRFLPHRPACC